MYAIRSYYDRLGITTGKKVGNAVFRNRARRVLKAAYQECELSFPLGYDIVIVARKEACLVKTDVIKNFFINKVIKTINITPVVVNKKKKV